MIDLSKVKWVNIHTHYLHQQENTIAINDLDLFETDDIPKDERLYALGIHPWYLDDLLPGDTDRFRKLSISSKIVAIGETGLDKACDTPYPLQRKFFVDQIHMSESLNKPLIVHCVKAWPELITIFKAEQPKQPWIIHGFNSSGDIVNQLTTLGIYLSFGRSLLNPESKSVKELHNVPDNLLFLETDDSAVEMQTIYEKAAEIKGITVEELSEIIKNNFIHCFKLK